MVRLAITGLLLVLAACNGRDPQSIVFAVASAPTVLDPRLASDAASERVNALLFDRLVVLDDRGEPVAQMGRWQQLGPRHYRVALVPERRAFADGRQPDAHDVVATYQSVLDPALASPHRGGLAHIESIVAGITVQAHPDFRCAVTMNQDESTFEIPDYILSRLQPSLHLGFPSRDDEKQILEYHLPFAAAELVGMTVDFLQSSHELRLDFSPRDGINILRYAMKRMAQDPDHPLSHDAVWRESVQACLGDEALDLEAQQEKRARRLGMQAVSMGLEDLLFDLDDPLRDIEGDDDDSSYGDDPDDDDDDSTF